MISLLISRIGKAIGDSRSADEVYVRLERARYLSRGARQQRREVVAAIDRELSVFLAAPVRIGDEWWRHVQRVLIEGAYLSWWGRVWGLQFTHR